VSRVLIKPVGALFEHAITARTRPLHEMG
jgi:hypothetical protein